MTQPPLREPPGAVLAGLREALDGAGFDATRIEAALGAKPPLPRTRLEVYRIRLQDRGALGTLIRLFRLGDAVERSAADAALAPADCDALADAGVLEANGDGITARIALTPYAGLVVAHDRSDPARPAPPWHVMFGAASRTLAALTIRRPAEAALDVGTGSGVQALLAARHARRVVATDLNERALTFTRMNAALNGVTNVECRPGDLFAPVAGERFDLVVSNPPFVISPDTDVLFRDSALPGDEISGHVVAQAAAHLGRTGHATVLCSWIERGDDDWAARPRGWIPAGCDAVVLQFTSVQPLDYAAMWTDQLERWLAYYRDEGVERIAIGAVILRHGDGRVRAFRANSAPRDGGGDQLLRIFDAEALDDAALLGARLRLVDHTLRQVATHRAGAYSIDLTGVELAGAPLNVRVEDEAIHVLPRLDGSATLAEVVDRAALETGLERDTLERAALVTARRLYERGFAVAA